MHLLLSMFAQKNTQWGVSRFTTQIYAWVSDLFCSPDLCVPAESSWPPGYPTLKPLVTVKVCSWGINMGDLEVHLMCSSMQHFWVSCSHLVRCPHLIFLNSDAAGFGEQQMYHPGTSSLCWQPMADTGGKVHTSFSFIEWTINSFGFLECYIPTKGCSVLLCKFVVVYSKYYALTVTGLTFLLSYVPYCLNTMDWILILNMWVHFTARLKKIGHWTCRFVCTVSDCSRHLVMPQKVWN